MLSSVTFIDKCLSLLSSGKLLPVIDGNKNRDSHLKNVQKVRDLGKLSPKWDVIIPSNHHFMLTEVCGRQDLNIVRASGDKGLQTN